MPLTRDPQTVGPEFRINTTTADDQYEPAVTTLVNGELVVAWHTRFPLGDRDFNVDIQRFLPDGAPAGVEARVNTRLVHSQYDPAIAALTDGGFVVSWSDSNRPIYGETAVVAQRHAADGTPIGGEIVIGATTIGTFTTSKVMGLSGGGFLVTWNLSIYESAANARLYAADGTPVGTAFNIEGSTVTALADGGFIVSWMASGRPGGDAMDVYAKRYTADGNSASDEFRVNTTVAGNQDSPAVEALPGGGFAVAWQGTAAGQPSGHTDVYARRFGADGTALGEEVRVSASNGRKADLTMAALDDGGLAVAWTGYEQAVGLEADIFAQRLLANGARGGAEFRVNATTGPHQARPNIEATADGGFIVVWDNRDAASRAYDVYAQRFALPPPSSAISIAANGPPRLEGNAGAAPFTFTVSLDLPHASEQRAQWSVADLRPHPVGGEDFAGGVLPSGTLVFAPGETTKTITVNIGGDANAEPDESITVELTAQTAGLIVATPSATATILNDDLAALQGTPGHDILVRDSGQFFYDGMEGRDSVDLRVAGYRLADLAAQSDGTLALSHGADTDALLRGVEELRFADGRLVFDPADPAARVARLYEAALDRLPDQGGLNFWIGAIQNGQPLSSLVSGFLASPEFMARFGDMPDSGAFVDRLYQNVLGRAGEPGGREFWVGSLDRGTGTRADVLTAFSESQENKDGTAALVQAGIWDRGEAAAQVARLYDTVFGRQPDMEGLVYWKNALEAGTATLGQMADAFTASAEFRATYGGLDNWDFAETLYRNSLDRWPGYSEMIYWEDSLDAGASRTAVVLAFSESPEHIALTAKTIGSENPAEFGILFA